MIEALLGSRDKENVLQYLLAKNEGYASEIANFFGTNSSQIIKQLEALETGGVLVSTQNGRARVFKFNSKYSFLKELKTLLIKVRDSYTADVKEKLTQAKTVHHLGSKPVKLLRIRQVVNRNVSRQYDLSLIKRALKGGDFTAKSTDEQLIIGRFFLEGTEDDFREAISVSGITKSSLKSLYLTSPYSANPVDTRWDTRFHVTPKKTLISKNPAGNKALQGFLKKKGHSYAL